ncbi:uncharacterized protein METZ01_LOCUS200529, partial [marine metagenome]
MVIDSLATAILDLLCPDQFHGAYADRSTQLPVKSLFLLVQDKFSSVDPISQNGGQPTTCMPRSCAHAPTFNDRDHEACWKKP